MNRSLVVFVVLGSLLIFNCKDGKRYHETTITAVPEHSSDIVSDILAFQHSLNEEFRNPETSPLPDKYRKNFKGLDFFPPDTNFRVKANLLRTPEAIPFMMPTTTDRKSEEVLYGIASFLLQGKRYELEIYQNLELMTEEGYEDYLFLPFLDTTNGEDTYSGGRYIDLAIPGGDDIVIDFNKAYNPYCAYNKKYSCPIVPKVNELNTAVVAGVKEFKK
ncbi:DUF1684 domain-containing protein [Muriicola sp. Z0-33]|uniref:DUF1684 domain-containing protein n=1 Tax=Muriicola sp. Z0-33 TaxID=2816957 RepID=UPI002237F290|nr:DUF1684 domain-containing protein [Muriicola sp. Z0-33]MCW5517585.1 DUF1684 domain-containing protein [Muriicola sp. Z0-33]